MSNMRGWLFLQEKTPEAALLRNPGFLSSAATHPKVPPKNAATLPAMVLNRMDQVQLSAIQKELHSDGVDSAFDNWDDVVRRVWYHMDPPSITNYSNIPELQWKQAFKPAPNPLLGSSLHACIWHKANVNARQCAANALKKKER